MTKANIAVTGLAVMGSNLARNFESKGFKVAVHNRTFSVTEEFIEKYKNNNFVACQSFKELINNLERPRKIIIMVKAGEPTDTVINQLLECLEPGDIILDGGNAWFKDTIIREERCKAKEILFMGVGISGGEEGALLGPSIMPSGEEKAWEAVKLNLEKIAAVAEGPCVTHIGADGSGHFVKMVHNGIEYADMQMIAETYHLLKVVGAKTNHELVEIFKSWNKGLLESFLIEITAKVLSKKDQDGSELVDKILDKAEQKGTGKWTAQVALDLGVVTSVISEAVSARNISAIKSERVLAAKLFNISKATNNLSTNLVGILEEALLCAKIIAYAQGFKLIQQAAKEYKWQINLSEVARIWKGGCIIRAKLLDNIQSAFRADPDIANLLIQTDTLNFIKEKHLALREVVAVASKSAIPIPCFSAALSYLDSYFSAHLPQNLTQAQRDFFGAHTYERIDKAGSFHTEW